MVEVKLFVDIKGKVPFGNKGKHSAVTDVPDGASIRDVMMILGVREERGNLCFVNGVHRDIDYVLKEHDVLLITPPLAGG